MAEGLLGRKRGMTQIFSGKGQVVPVSVLEVGPCYVTQIRTNDKEGYTAIQIGYEETRRLNSVWRACVLSEFRPAPQVFLFMRAKR